MRKTYARGRQLSADTLAALQGFYSEKDERQKHFEALKAKAEDEADDREWSIEDWGEDWQISQFWVSIMRWSNWIKTKRSPVHR